MSIAFWGAAWAVVGTEAGAIVGIAAEASTRWLPEHPATMNVLKRETTRITRAG
jgi:hypothetical protein